MNVGDRIEVYVFTGNVIRKIKADVIEIAKDGRVTLCGPRRSYIFMFCKHADAWIGFREAQVWALDDIARRFRKAQENAAKLAKLYNVVNNLKENDDGQ